MLRNCLICRRLNTAVFEIQGSVYVDDKFPRVLVCVVRLRVSRVFWRESFFLTI